MLFIKAILAVVIIGILSVNALFSKQEQPKTLAQKQDAQYISTTISGRAFKLPVVYLEAPYPTERKPTFSIVAMYPDFTPIKEDQADLLKKGEWYKSVSVNISAMEDIRPIPEIIETFLSSYHLDKDAGEQYGLTYRTFSEYENNRSREMWVEGNNKSYITCSLDGRLADGRPLRPHCRHVTSWREFSLRIQYSKRLLENWEEIRSGVISILEDSIVKEIK